MAALLGLYLIGFLAAVVTARLLKSSVLKSAQAPFLLETGGWKWPILQFAYMGVLAYVGAFLAYHAIG